MGTAPRDAGEPPRCVHCGELIMPGRAPGTWTHKARIVAACDLDADHRPEPAPPAPAPPR